MGIFGGIGKASRNGGRYPWISRPGVTLCQVKRAKAGTNRNSQPFGQLDLEVIAVLGECVGSDIENWNAVNPEEAMRLDPHSPGSLVANRVAVKPGDLRETHLGEVKDMFVSTMESLADGDMEALATAFGIELIDGEFDDDGFDMLVFDGDNGLAAGDGTNAAGALVVVTSDPRVTRNGAGSYIVNSFANGNDVARELVSEGKLDAKYISRWKE